MVIIYTIILVFFAGFNIKNDDNQVDFIATKPDVLIVNNDKDSELSKSLVKYLEDRVNIIDIENEPEKVDDAIFFRDINYAIFIPENFSSDFSFGKKPKIEVKSSGDYNSNLASMMLQSYLNVAELYRTDFSGSDLIEKIESTLKDDVKVKITSSLNRDKLSTMAGYYNFANYSLLAGCVFVICMILCSFKDSKIQKRTIISSIDYKKYNFELLLSNALFAIVLWAIYVFLSFLMIGKSMMSIHGLLFAINSLIFTICSLTIAFLIGNTIKSKEAISGLVNVIALGSSFLCGAFVPVEFLPNFVLKIAHILPSYYYIDTNNAIKTLETFDLASLKPLLENSLILFAFVFTFIILTNIITSKNRKKANF